MGVYRHHRHHSPPTCHFFCPLVSAGVAMTFVRGTRSSGTRGFSAGQKPLSLELLDDEDRKKKCAELLDDLGLGFPGWKLRWDEFTFRCPLEIGNMHMRGDRRPSAQLNWRKLAFYCHICNRGMGIIQFITEVTSIKAEAVAWMMKDVDPGHESRHIETPEPQTIHSLDELVPFVGPPHPYLLERGIPFDNIVKHRDRLRLGHRLHRHPGVVAGRSRRLADTTSGRRQHHRRPPEVHVLKA